VSRSIGFDAIAAAAVIASFEAVRSGRGARMDAAIADVAARPLGHGIDRVVAAATDLGSVYALAGATSTLALLGRRRLARDVLGAGLIAWGLAQGAKPLAGRDRPYQADGADRLVAEPAGSSWPSGHVAVATAVGAAAATGHGRAARRLGTGLALFVGASRVYVGVHYPTDVFGGLGVGWLSARLWQRASQRGDRAGGRSG